MIRYQPLLHIPGLRIGRVDHPAEHHHHDPIEEVSPEYSVNRVERGNFVVQVGRRRWDLRPGDLFLNYPGMEFRCRHHDLEPNDVCTTIAYASANEDEETTQFEGIARRQPVLPPSNRLAYLFLHVVHADGSMAAEEAAHDVLADIAGRQDQPRKCYRDHQLRWYAERVDATRSRIERDFAAPHKLHSLARSVGMSPYHFARIFRELVGVAPHSYLRRMRLQYAARSLRDGASVTEACFNSGFQNLSHFCRQFYRHYGIKASSYRHLRLR